MPILLTALVALEYDGKRVPVGATFAVHMPEDAAILKYLLRAADAPPAATASSPVEDAPEPVKPKRKYTRRTPKVDESA